MIVAFWITSLFNQLSIDEAYTIWASNRSDFSESLKRVLFEWNQAPLYYAIPWSLIYLGMDAEWQLRIPSLVLGLISCAVILKIGTSLVSPAAGRAAMLLWAVSEGTYYLVTNARPYSLSTLLALASLHYTIQQCRHPRAISLALQTVTTLAAICTHFFFAGIILIQGLFLVCEENRRGIRSLLLSYGCLACCGWFIAPHALTILSQSSAFQLSGRPALSDLIVSLLPPATLILIFLSTVITRGLPSVPNDGDKRRTISPRVLTFLVLWHTAPVLIVFMLAYYQNNSSLMNTRFLIWQTPALALLLGAALSHLQTPILYTRTLFIFVILAITNQIMRENMHDGWREAISILRTQVMHTPDTTRIYYPGVMELQSVNHLSETSRREMVTAPLRYYNYDHAIDILPALLPDTEVVLLLERLTQSASTVSILGQDLLSFDGKRPSRYLESLLRELGFKSTSIHYFERTWLLVAQRAS
jgi:hypothetical protein